MPKTLDALDPLDDLDELDSLDTQGVLAGGVGNVCARSKPGRPEAWPGEGTG
jgi:hypothetical protein